MPRESAKPIIRPTIGIRHSFLYRSDIAEKNATVLLNVTEAIEFEQTERRLQNIALCLSFRGIYQELYP